MREGGGHEQRRDRVAHPVETGETERAARFDVHGHVLRQGGPEIAAYPTGVTMYPFQKGGDIYITEYYNIIRCDSAESGLNFLKFYNP